MPKQIIDGIHRVKPAVSLTKLVPVISRIIAKARNIYAYVRFILLTKINLYSLNIDEKSVNDDLV